MKWELHLHTSESSLCGQVPAAAAVARHRKAGFTGIVVTDHYNEDTLRVHPGNPLDRAKAWLGGYQSAREAGERTGVTVLFGAEVRLTGCDNDYLLYGIRPDFVLENPELYDLSLPALHALVRRHRGVIIQAHPFRLGCCHPMDPLSVDGYEIFNGNPRQQNRNELSAALAAKNPSLVYTSGSDYHRIEDMDIGSMDTDIDIRSSADLAACLRSGAFSRTPERPGL